MCRMKCAVGSCDRSARTRGWCDMHYRRWKQHGSVDARPKVVLGERCTWDGCTNRPIARELCKQHYYQAKRDLERALRPPPPPRPRCSIDGCSELATAKGWCGAHYQRWRRFGDPTAHPTECRKQCTVEGCEKPTNARGWCSSHYYRWQTYGDPLIGRHKKRRTAATRQLPPRPCATCGKAFDPGSSYRRKYCNRRCRPTRASAGVNNRRTVERLGDRDGWTCKLCGADVDRTLYWPNLHAGSVDHNIPVAAGGNDDSNNLQLTHLSCNLQKGVDMPLPD